MHGVDLWADRSTLSRMSAEILTISPRPPTPRAGVRAAYAAEPTEDLRP
jgi:hypothetical protein